MKRTTGRFSATVFSLLFGLFFSCSTDAPRREGYPPGHFPQGFHAWPRIKTTLLRQEDQESFQYKEIYVNPLGYDLVGEGGAFPEGTVWVCTKYRLREDGARLTRGKPMHFSVMKKVMGKEETGGWIYEQYDAEGKPLALENPAGNCHNCHKSMEIYDFVFSKFPQKGQ